MSIGDFVYTLEERNIFLVLNGDKLNIKAKEESITQAQIEEIKSKRGAIIEYLKCNKPFSIYDKVEESSYYPTSYAQKQIYAISQFPSIGTTYNLYQAMWFNKTISQDELESQFLKIINKQEILRTTFHIQNNDLVQKVHDEINFSVHHQKIEKNELNSKLQNAIAEFDLSAGPLIRVNLFELQENESVVLVDTHHIVSDGISMTIIWEELISMVTGGSLKDSNIKYKDFCNWQQKKINADSFTKEKKFWKEQLAGTLPELQLPYDFDQDQTHNFEGQIQIFHLDEEISKTIKKYCEETRLSLNMFLMACYAILLAKLADIDDLIIGTLTSGRNNSLLSQIVGMFVNTLPFRSHPAGDKTIKQFLDETRNTLLQVLEYDSFPIGSLIPDLNNQNDHFKHQLFSTLFVYQLTDTFNDNKTDFRAESIPFATTTSKYDLTVSAFDSEGRIGFRIEYKTKLFKNETIKRFEKYYENIIKTALVDPSIKLSQVDLLSPQEQQEETKVLDNLDVSYPDSETVNSLFEKQVIKTPHNIAVEYESQQLSYLELDRASNKLANFLIAKGVKKGTIVAVLLGRDITAISSILAIIKAGGVYLPIDINNSAKRIKYLLEDSAATTIISTSEILDASLSEEFERLRFNVENIVYLDQDHSSIQDQSDSPTGVVMYPTDVIYIIYTSGTTGMPKGAVLEHENVVRLLFNDAFQFNFGSTDVWSLFHSLNFDFSVWELYGALLTGAKLVVVKEATARDTGAFLKLLKAKNVTVLNQTPQAFYSLAALETSLEEKEIDIRYVIFGGERLMPKKLKAWNKKYPHTKLINMYGITETTVHVTYKEITKVEIESNESNIGKLLPTLKGCVVNKDNRPVPPGVIGELLVAGKGVARGYLNKPELTAEKFSINEFGEKYYHSGDLVKLNSSGDLIYIGRNDKQLKIRGYRVEPKEIENSLLEYGGITNAVVRLQNLGGDVKSEELSLCAYYTAAKNIDGNTLYNFLRPKLPSYYIPSYFIQMDEIPLTSNGKINYKSLPLPSNTGASASSDISDKSKLKIIEIFNELIHTRDFDVNHSFFSIGGDSIKVIRLSAMLEKAFDIKFSIVDLYHNDTVNKILSFISSAEFNHNEEQYQLAQNYLASLKDETLLEIDSTGIQDLYPMSDIEAGMCYHYLRYIDQYVYHDNFGFSVKFSNFQNNLFKKACELLFEKHDIFRSVFHLESFKLPIKVVYNEVKLDYKYLDISNQNIEEQQSIISSAIKEDLDHSYQLESYPLIRLFTYKLNSKSIYLFISAHHAILDGWSVNAFLVELFNLYKNLCEDINTTVKPLKSSYRDAVIHEIVEKNKKENQIFWKNYLSDYKRLIVEKNEVDENPHMPIYKHVCEKSLFLDLKKYSESTSISLKNLLFSAFAYSMSVFNNQKDFVLGIVTNLRPPVEDGEAILGCFLNTVPVNINISRGQQTWREYVEEVHDNLQEIKLYERISLFEITKQVPENTSNKNPFFDVLFNYLDFHINEDLEIDYDDLFDHKTIKVDKHTNTNTYLDFEITVTTNELVLIPKYNRNYFNEGKVSKICQYFINTLNAILNQSNDIIDSNCILPTPERQEVQNKFADGPYSTLPYTNLIEPFEKSVAQYPDNYAIETSHHKITYNELNKSANELAHVLDELGEVNDTLFGVMTERSSDMIKSVISILKAGYAYVPIETNQPADRISKIITNSSMRNLIISSSLLVEHKDLINGLSAIRKIICLEKNHPEVSQIEFQNKKIIFYSDIASLKDENLSLLDKSNRPAYVIYTSGTTGMPKGVLVHHGTVINTLDWVNKTQTVTSNDKLLFVNSLAFDLSVYDIFGILWAGGSIRLAEEKEKTDPDKLFDVLVNERVSIWNSAPASLQQLLPRFENTEDPSEELSLRLVMLSGDWIPLSLVPIVQKRIPNGKIVSLGGATEASIWSNYFEIHDIKKNWKSIPYGKPIQNAKYYILDDTLKLCPIGTQGDLYIGGNCLAVGYLNDSELTSKKFIPNPYLEGDIIYKTGDQARWFEDGNMEFLGRNDNQVKIRGYRIELGEIENQLNKIDQIKHNVVHVFKENGTQTLCAYYIADTSLDREFFKNYLKEKLPDYMIPLHFIRVDSFKMTSNGKLDRKNLPKPSLEGLQQKPYVAPKSEIEKQLCQIYQEFFDVEKIGTTEDFYDIGGDSLKAINILSIIKKELKIKVELKAFFEAPSIRELALQIENKLYFSQKPSSTSDSTIYI